jgi:phosphomannomutase
MNIFKEYDIRGVYPDELDENKSYRIGLAVARLVEKEKLFLSYDNRVGSLNIKTSFINGLISGGAVVYDSGLYPITVPAFASFKENAYGVCITASHNPAKYTGILMFRNGTGSSVTPDKIKKRMNAKPLKKKGRIVDYDYSDEYLKYISKGINRLNLKIGIDSMGGSTTDIAVKLFQRLGAEVHSLHPKMSSDFYGKVPEPSKDNSRGLGRFILRNGLDFGIQLDADGDRVMFVDNEGKVLDPMTSAMIFIKYLKLKETVATVGCSMLLENYAKVTYTKVGRTHVEAELEAKKYDFGVETSSHFYFGKYYPFSDGLLGGLLMANVLSKTGRKLSEILKEFPKVYHGDLSIKVKNQGEANKKMKMLIKRLSIYGKSLYLDGIKTFIKDGFILFRKSNTEPLVRGHYEAKSESTARYLNKLMRRIAR